MRLAGLEPARLSTHAPQACVSTIPPQPHSMENNRSHYTLCFTTCQAFMHKRLLCLAPKTPRCQPLTLCYKTHALKCHCTQSDYFICKNSAAVMMSGLSSPDCKKSLSSVSKISASALSAARSIGRVNRLFERLKWCAVLRIDSREKDVSVNQHSHLSPFFPHHHLDYHRHLVHLANAYFCCDDYHVSCVAPSQGYRSASAPNVPRKHLHQIR